MGKQVAAGFNKKTGCTSDQRLKLDFNKRFWFLVTDKNSVRKDVIMYLENCIYENNPKNVKRLEIGKDIRGVIF